MTALPILSLVTFAPLVGVFGITVLRMMRPADDPGVVNASKWIALVSTLVFVLVLRSLAALTPPARRARRAGP